MSINRPDEHEPVKHTCPDIDRIKKECDSASRSAQRAAKETDDDNAKDELECAAYTLDCIADPLEELRKANASLRDWGNEWRQYAEQVEDECANLTQQIDDLRGELAGAQAQRDPKMLELAINEAVRLA